MAYELLDEPGFEMLPEAAAPMSKAERFAQGLRDPLQGGAQLLTNILPSGVVSAGNKLNNWIADKTGLVGRLPEGGVDQQTRELEAEYKARNAGQGFDAMRLAGNVFNPANLAIASKLPAAASFLGRIGVGVGGGAATSLMNPVAEGDYASEKGKQLAVGMISGGVVPAATGALARVVSPAASINPNVQMLRQAGVTPTMGQATGGLLNSIEQKLTSAPVVGDAISASRRTAVEEFNRAAINRALAPIQARTTAVGHDAVREAGDAIGQALNTARASLGNFQVDQQAAQQLQTLRQMANQLPRKEQRAFNEMWNTFQGELTPQGHLLQDSYQRLRETLGKRASDFGGSTDAYQRQVGAAFREMDRALEQNALRSNPQAAQMLADGERAYANLVRVEGAAKLANRSDGIFTPGQLLGAVRTADKSTRDRATARGTALMQDLGRAGQEVLGNTVPDSGTTGRVLASIVATGGLGALSPASAGGLLGLGAMYTPAMQRLMSAAVSARPQAAQPVANALRQSSPAFVPLGAQVGLGLLN